MAKKGKKKGGRRYMNIPLGGIGVAASAAYALNIPQALGKAVNGDIEGAGQVLASQGIADVIAAAAPAVGYGIAKKFLGPIPLLSIGRVRITLL